MVEPLLPLGRLVEVQTGSKMSRSPDPQVGRGCDRGWVRDGGARVSGKLDKSQPHLPAGGAKTTDTFLLFGASYEF